MAISGFDARIVLPDGSFIRDAPKAEALTKFNAKVGVLFHHWL
jgi:hypothetical protein